jgi:hypothetical protein
VYPQHECRVKGVLGQIGRDSHRACLAWILSAHPCCLPSAGGCPWLPGYSTLQDQDQQTILALHKCPRGGEQFCFKARTVV